MSEEREVGRDGRTKGVREKENKKEKQKKGRLFLGNQ